MRAMVLVAFAATAMLSLAPLPTTDAAANTVRTAQLDLNPRRTPQPTPNVVIEEPRPPQRDGRDGRAGRGSELPFHDRIRAARPVQGHRSRTGLRS